jgi:hypothetical protein
MGAIKKFDVTGASENTLAVGVAATYSHAQLFSDTAGTVPIGNAFLLTTPQPAAADSLLNILDDAIAIKLGVTTDVALGQLKNAELIAMLDARYPTGVTNITIRFGTGINAGTGALVGGTSWAHTLDAVKAAVAF